MLTLPIEQAKQRLTELAEQIAAGGEPIALKLSDGRLVVLSGSEALPWIEHIADYQAPSADATREALVLAADLRAKIGAMNKGQEGESTAEALERVRQERLNGLSGSR